MADKKTYEQLEEELESMGQTLGRLVTSDSFNRYSAKKHYEKQRSLENAIRRHATGACKCRGPKQCMSQLAKLIPVQPRQKYGRSKKKVAVKNG